MGGEGNSDTHIVRTAAMISSVIPRCLFIRIMLLPGPQGRVSIARIDRLCNRSIDHACVT
eukprot:120330-Pyramimonas_sp.AAC.1